ncbi:hypothetical protein ACC684_28375 [Rhizobium ruizarguesonis]
MKPNKVFFNRFFDTGLSLACIAIAAIAAIAGGGLAILAGITFYAWQAVATVAANPLKNGTGFTALAGRIVFVGLVSLGMIPALYMENAKLHPEPSKADMEWAERVSNFSETCPVYFKWIKDNPRHTPPYQFDFCNDYVANPAAWREKTADLLMQRGFKYEANSVSGRTDAELARIKANPAECKKYTAMSKAERHEVSALILMECDKPALIDNEATASTTETSSGLWK